MRKSLVLVLTVILLLSINILPVRASTNTVLKTSTTNQNVSNKGETLRKGELISWKSAKNIFRIGSIAEITDVNTGKKFRIKRTMGSNHADCESLTRRDTEIIRSIWAGFNWNVRPVIISVNGRKLAASMSSMPHAGVDAAPAFKTVSNRSGGYSRGSNLDVVKENGMNGHFDVHFLNSTRHKDGKKDPRHQAAILKAAGRN